MPCCPPFTNYGPKPQRNLYYFVYYQLDTRSLQMKQTPFQVNNRQGKVERYTKERLGKAQIR